MTLDLQRAAEYAQYALRSSFYYRTHYKWAELLALLHRVSAPDWTDRQAWGISNTAWSRFHEKREAPEGVFCHPSVITLEPRLIAYYRCLALLPQKGLQRLAVGTQNLEESGGKLTSARAVSITRVLNNLVSLLIDSDPNWTLEGACTAALLNLGSQINGSWRNEIGNEGARRVQELVIAFALEDKRVEVMTLEDGSQIPPGELQSGMHVRGIRLSNQFTLGFGSEPDIAVRNVEGVLVATIEVKYGLDPAGALERYGAAMRSFASATRENARVSNVYLASTITPEVRRRISEDRLVNRDFNLTEVLHNADRRKEFLNYLFRTVIEL